VAGFAPEPNFERTFRCNPAYHLAAHRANFLATAICLILRSADAELRGVGKCPAHTLRGGERIER